MDVLILNIETSTNVCSVAISKNGRLISLSENSDGFSHASKITNLIKNSLDETQLKMSDLHAVAVASGPGSYTSLRVGCSTAKGICYALNLPLITVSTLKILALEGYRRYPQMDYFIPMIDARRMEVYASIYEKTTVIKKNFNIIVKENTFYDIFTKNKHIAALGNGAQKTKSIIQHENYHTFSLECSASYMTPISYDYFVNNRFEDLVYFTPNYLKSPNITKPKPRF